MRKYSININQIKVIFCGNNLFQSSFNYTKEYLKNNEKIIIKQCNNNNLENDLKGMFVVVGV